MSDYFVMQLLREVEPVFANLCKDSNAVRPEIYDLWLRIQIAIRDRERPYYE